MIPLAGRLWRLLVAIYRGEMRNCDRCGKFTQCLRFGDTITTHWESFVELPDFMPLPIPADAIEKHVCFDCDFDLANELQLHRCCCDRVMREQLGQEPPSPEVTARLRQRHR